MDRAEADSRDDDCSNPHSSSTFNPPHRDECSISLNQSSQQLHPPRSCSVISTLQMRKLRLRDMNAKRDQLRLRERFCSRSHCSPEHSGLNPDLCARRPRLSAPSLSHRPLKGRSILTVHPKAGTNASKNPSHRAPSEREVQAPLRSSEDRIPVDLPGALTEEEMHSDLVQRCCSGEAVGCPFPVLPGT